MQKRNKGSVGSKPATAPKKQVVFSKVWHFKRATGIYPQAYKKMVMADRHAKNLHQKASTART